MSPAPAARRSVRRLATRLYTAALRLLPDALPPGGRGAAAEAFDALQDEAWQARGARGLAGCWLAETGSLARLLAPRPHLPRRPMTMLTHDLRDAYRALRRSPGFTLVVVVTLALGIGMNTAIFSVVDALLFKSLPYADAERLVVVAERHPLGGRNTVAPANFLDWQARATSFTGLAARQSRTETLLDGDEPRTLRGALVSVNYFALLGVDAALGRVFTDADGRPDAPCAVVISHRLFAQQLGADTARLGRDLAFAAERCTLVGVLPADSVFDRGAYDVYRPLVLGPGATRSSHFLTVFGRLAPGTTVARADAEMVAVAAAISGEHPEIELDWSATVVPLRDVVVRADTARLAWVLMGAVALVLLIATVNIAGLGLSRAVARRPEVSVRVALGAGRWRVFRGLLVESLLLSATGAAAGVGVGRIALRAFSAYMPAGTLPAEAIATLDGRALAFTALLAVVTGLLAGTVPAWHGARDNVSGALRSTGRSVSGSRASARLHGGLLVTEIALAMILVTGAALLVASFVRLTRVSPGFDATDVLTLRLSLPETRYRSAQAVADFYGRVTANLQALPRVAGAAAITSLPLGGWLYGATFSVEGEPVDPARPPAAHVQHATPSYFETLGIPLAAGRAFTTRDDARAPLVAVINETFARRFIPAGDAVGRVVRMDEFNLQGEDDARWRIVGVIRDVKTYGLDDAELATPEVYIPVAQSPTPSLFVTVRSDGSPATALVPDVRAAIRTLDPELPIADLQTMTDRVGGSVTSERFRTALVGGFAALAALLACLGVYAVRSQAVVARRREIGIRVALGAKRGDVLAMVLGQSARLVVAGLGLGLAGALAMTRVLDRWLFATDARDPWMLAGAMAALGLAAIAASWVPARRAAAVDPLTVLRDA